MYFELNYINTYRGEFDMEYIIYKITNMVNNKIYIGKHKTNNIEDGYNGSGTRLKEVIKLYGEDKFQKEILYQCNSEEEMNRLERKIVDEEFVKRPDTYNLTTGGDGGWYHTKGTTTVKDKDGNSSRISIDDPRYLSGELKGICSGTSSVIDKNGNVFRINIDDLGYISGELRSISYGKVSVVDEYGNRFQVNKSDPRYLSGELKFLWCGKKHTHESKIKIGKANSIHQKGSGNSQYGTCWVYNENLRQNKKIKKEELNEWLENGWHKGRRMTF